MITAGWRSGTAGLARQWIVLTIVVALVLLRSAIFNFFSSAAGPGTSIAALHAQPSNNIRELARRTCVRPSRLFRGAQRLLDEHWPLLLGTARYPLSHFSIESREAQGLAFSSVLPLGAAIIAVARILTREREIVLRMATSFAGFLVFVGVFSAVGYTVGRCGELNVYTMRYELMSLLGIAGLGAWFLAVEPSRRIVSAWVLIVVCWVGLGAISHARLWREYLTHPPVGTKHLILRALDARGVRYGWADYWIAYYITFLSNERIVLASSDFVRIRTYEDIVRAHAPDAVRISREPCSGSELIMGIYVCDSVRGPH
jgi:hypothetical protein